jgi:hypothetical protein
MAEEEILGRRLLPLLWIEPLRTMLAPSCESAISAEKAEAAAIPLGPSHRRILGTKARKA